MDAAEIVTTFWSGLARRVVGIEALSPQLLTLFK
jgi:hypothetical protein